MSDAAYAGIIDGTWPGGCPVLHGHDGVRLLTLLETPGGSRIRAALGLAPAAAAPGIARSGR
jgi:hypothetical protein